MIELKTKISTDRFKCTCLNGQVDITTNEGEEFHQYYQEQKKQCYTKYQQGWTNKLHSHKQAIVVTL